MTDGIEFVPFDQASHATTAVEEAPEYWKTIWALTAIGQVDRAKAYLGVSSHFAVLVCKRRALPKFLNVCEACA